MAESRVEREIKSFASRNNRLERQSVRLGTASETSDLWEKIEDELHTNKEMSKELVKTLKGLPDTSQKKYLVDTFRKEYKRFQSIVMNINQTAGGEDGVDIGSMGVTPGIDGSSHLQQQQHLEIDEAKTLEDKEKKAAKVRQLNRDVQDLAEMFHDVAALVNQQQETVDKIAINVEKTKVHTHQAVSELAQADEYLQSARRKWCCIFTILFIIIAIVVGVVVGLTMNN